MAQPAAPSSAPSAASLFAASSPSEPPELPPQERELVSLFISVVGAEPARGQKKIGRHAPEVGDAIRMLRNLDDAAFDHLFSACKQESAARRVRQTAEMTAKATEEFKTALAERRWGQLLILKEGLNKDSSDYTSFVRRTVFDKLAPDFIDAMKFACNPFKKEGVKVICELLGLSNLFFRILDSCIADFINQKEVYNIHGIALMLSCDAKNKDPRMVDARSVAVATAIRKKNGWLPLYKTGPVYFFSCRPNGSMIKPNEYEEMSKVVRAEFKRCCQEGAALEVMSFLKTIPKTLPDGCIEVKKCFFAEAIQLAKGHEMVLNLIYIHLLECQCGPELIQEYFKGIDTRSFAKTIKES